LKCKITHIKIKKGYKVIWTLKYDTVIRQNVHKNNGKINIINQIKDKKNKTI